MVLQKPSGRIIFQCVSAELLSKTSCLTGHSCNMGHSLFNALQREVKHADNMTKVALVYLPGSRPLAS